MGNAASDKESDSNKGQSSQPSTPSVSRKKSQNNGSPQVSKTSVAGVNNKLLSNNQKDLIRQNWDSSKRTEISVRIYKRVFDKRPDLKRMFDTMGEELWLDEARNFGEFIDAVVGSLDDFNQIQQLSLDLGRRHGEWRAHGFKSEFSVAFAEAMTTECVYLDASAHPTGDVLGAWGTLVQFIFGCVRDGYYEQLKLQRKLSRKLSKSAVANVRAKQDVQRTNSLLDENGLIEAGTTSDVVDGERMMYVNKYTTSPHLQRRY